LNYLIIHIINYFVINILTEDSVVDIPSMIMPYASSTDSGICDVLKLCLYGEVETIRLHFEPDTLYFGDLIVGQISQRVLRLTNPSAFAPIYLECTPNAAARCYPNWMRLEPQTSIEVLVKVCGNESSNYHAILLPYSILLTP
jgi:hypothetical protein